MADPFDSPKLLISHAREEIEDAHARLRTFFEGKPYARVVDLDRETGQEVHKIRLTGKLPGKVTVIAKDAASNLRDALDHATYACAVRLVGGEPSSTGFPFARDAAGVVGELGSKRLSGIPPEIRPLLAGLDPHEGGNQLLWGLNSIRNPNTHRMIVPVGQAIANQSISIDYMVMTGNSRVGYSRWDAAKNEIEYMRLGPGSSAQYDIRVSFEVVFEGTHALGGKPVIPTLLEIASEVERVVLAIEAETARILRERAAP